MLLIVLVKVFTVTINIYYFYIIINIIQMKKRKKNGGNEVVGEIKIKIKNINLIADIFDHMMYLLFFFLNFIYFLHKTQPNYIYFFVIFFFNIFFSSFFLVCFFFYILSNGFFLFIFFIRYLYISTRETRIFNFFFVF